MALKLFLVLLYLLGLLLFVLSTIIVQPVLVTIGAAIALLAFVLLWLRVAADERHAANQRATRNRYGMVLVERSVDRLTEQQRTANLIAWQQASGESNRAEIRRGLGI